MAGKLKLTSKEILDKVFPITNNGYDALLVDEFLDLIMVDYKQIERSQEVKNIEISESNDNYLRVVKERDELLIDITKLKSKLKTLETTNNISQDNIDLVKRIVELEKFLWNHGFDPSKIK